MVIDYRDLLMRTILHFGETEGTTHIGLIGPEGASHQVVRFSDEEIEELTELDNEGQAARRRGLVTPEGYGDE